MRSVGVVEWRKRLPTTSAVAYLTTPIATRATKGRRLVIGNIDFLKYIYYCRSNILMSSRLLCPTREADAQKSAAIDQFVTAMTRYCCIMSDAGPLRLSGHEPGLIQAGPRA